MEVKAGYKQTDIGVIPQDWTVKTLGELASITAGGTPSRSNTQYWNGDIPWITTTEVDFNIIDRAEQFITKEGLNNSAAKLLPPGTLLMALYGQGKTRGKVAVLGIEAATNQACAAITLNRNVFGDFIFRYLMSQYKAIRNLSNTGNQENLNSSLVRSIQIILPSPAEQKAIAEALSDVDALIEALEQLIAKKRQVKQGAMQELLTGKRRLPGFSGEWKETALGELGKIHRGVSYNPNRDLSPFDTNSTIRLLRSNNIQDATVVFVDMQYVDASRVSSDQIMQNNDVLICMANGSKSLVGKAGRFHNEDGYRFTFGAFMGCFRPNGQVNPDFAFYLFLTGEYRTHISILLAGSSINNLTPTNVEAFNIEIPTDMKEQTAIAEILSDMDAEIVALEGKLSKARQVKQGMMQELLTGKIRLI